MINNIKNMVPPAWRRSYCALRGWCLSLDLNGNGPFVMSEPERKASEALSIVVAVHDAPEVTERCLKSLERFSGKAEVIIIDDGSKLETTRQVLDEACARNPWRLIRNERAQGHSRASEAGVAVAGRAYVCLLNSDTVATPHSWHAIMKAFAVSPQIAIVGPSTSYTPTPQCVPRASRCRTYWSDEQIWRFAEKYAARHSDEGIVDLPLAGGFAFFVRRSSWDQLGGFDRNLPDYGNETDLCRRAKGAGLRVVWAKGSYIHHLGSESYGKTLGLKEISRRCVAAKHYIEAKIS